MVLWRSSRRSNRARRVGLTRSDCERSGSVTEVMPALPQARRCSRVPTASRPEPWPAPRAVSSSGVPRNTMCPRSMSATSVQAAPTSSTRCVLTTTVAVSPNSRSTARNCTRCSGSSPAVGSSNSSSSGSLTMAWAIPTRRNIPPERVRSLDLALSPSSTRSTAAATAAGIRAGGISFKSAKYSTNSTTVNPG